MLRALWHLKLKKILEPSLQIEARLFKAKHTAPSEIEAAESLRQVTSATVKISKFSLRIRTQWPAKLEVECHEALRNANKCQGMSRNAEELKITSGNPKCLASGTISHITDAKQMFLTHGFNSSMQCRVTKKRHVGL